MLAPDRPRGMGTMMPAPTIALRELDDAEADIRRALREVVSSRGSGLFPWDREGTAGQHNSRQPTAMLRDKNSGG